MKKPTTNSDVYHKVLNFICKHQHKKTQNKFRQIFSKENAVKIHPKGYNTNIVTSLFTRVSGHIMHS